jgi:hypothetical protein
MTYKEAGSIQRIVVDNQGAGVGGVHLSKIVNAVDGSMIDVIASRYCRILGLPA